MKHVATAHSNIALVKYWGKRDHGANLPAAGSFSATLGDLTTTTSVEPIEGDADRVTLDGEEDTSGRLSRFLDLLRDRADRRTALHVETSNDFPTAAGLASSASGFAALTLAATRALGLELDERELTRLARRGSGSAARSLHGGWVEVVPTDDAYAVRVAEAGHWDLRCVVFLTAEGSKKVGSTDGMNHTVATSNYFDAWVDSVPADIEAAKQAVLARDLERLATVAERSCLRMHASALAADPGVLYWNGATVELIHRVREARSSGLPAFFTIDAGPHVKVFCPADAVPGVEALGEGVSNGVILSSIGGAAEVDEVAE